MGLQTGHIAPIAHTLLVVVDYLVEEGQNGVFQSLVFGNPDLYGLAEDLNLLVDVSAVQDNCFLEEGSELLELLELDHALDEGVVNVLEPDRCLDLAAPNVTYSDVFLVGVGVVTEYLLSLVQEKVDQEAEGLFLVEVLPTARGTTVLAVVREFFLEELDRIEI